MNQILHRHHISLTHAVDGLLNAVRTQPNFRVHIAVSLIAVFFGFFLRVSGSEWAILVLTITLGLVIELLNTSIEYTVDLLTQEYRLLAKFAKDTSAAAMLVYAFGATVVAVIIFVPKIIELWLYT